jgi:hypothetical protein
MRPPPKATLNRVMLIRCITILLFTILLASCGGSDNRTEKKDMPKKEEQRREVIADMSIDDMKKERSKLQQEVTVLNETIKEKENEQTATLAKWTARICLALSFLLLIGSIFARSYPLLPGILRVSSVSFGGLAFLAYAIIPLIPYVSIIAVSATALLILIAGLYWFLEHRATKQIISAVEGSKHEIKDYKERFRKHIDKRSNILIDGVRKRLSRRV